MELIFKPFDYTSELQEQRELFADCFPERIGTYETEDGHYLWKFHSFPTEGAKSYEYIAKSDAGGIVGYYACLPYRYKIGERIVTSAMVCDVMTSSKCRGQGVFTKLGRYSTSEFAKEGLAFSIGYPIRKAPIPGHMKVGWKMVYDMPLYMHFLSVKSVAKEKGFGWAGYLVDPFVKFYALLSGKRDSKGYEIKICHKPDEMVGYAEFFSNWQKGVRNALIKDMPFMKWRYGDAKSKFLFFCAYKDGNMVGMLSAKEMVKEGAPSYGIVDFMVLNGEEKCLANLHNAIKRSAKANGKEALMTMMSRTSSKKYRMLANGYLKSPFTFHLIIKKFDESLTDDELFDENNWHLMFTDSDDLS